MGNNYIEISSNECKGCKLCITACPKKCISIGSDINEQGYQYASFKSSECIACGFCFYICPEPGAVTVIKGDS